MDKEIPVANLPEQVRVPNVIREVVSGQPDEFDLATAVPQEFPGWPKPAVGEPAVIGNLLANDAPQAGLQIWGRVAENGGFDKSGIVITPIVSDFQEALNQNRFVGIQAGHSEGDQMAVLGSNPLSKQRLGPFMDARLYQLGVSVASDGKLRLTNLDPQSRVSVIRSEQLTDRFDSADQKRQAEHAADVFEVAEEAGEVAVEDAVQIAADPAGPASEAIKHPLTDWSAITVNHSANAVQQPDTPANEPAADGIRSMTEAVKNTAEGDLTVIPIVDREPALAPDSMPPAEAFGQPEAPPVAEVPEVSEAAETPPPVAETAPEPLDIRQIFASGVNFETALSDPQVDPETRESLNRLAGAWKDLRVATVTNRVWEETMQPRLRQFAEVLPETVNKTGQIVDIADALAQQLEIAAQQMRDNDLESLSHTFAMTNGLANEFEGLSLKDGSLADALQSSTRILDAETLEVNDEIRQVERMDPYAPLSGKEADMFVDELGADITQLDDIAALTESLKGQTPGDAVSWHARQSVIAEAVRFSIGTVTSQDSAETFRSLLSARNELLSLREKLAGDWQRTNPQELIDAAQRLHQASVALRPSLEMARRASLELARAEQ